MGGGKEAKGDRGGGLGEGGNWRRVNGERTEEQLGVVGKAEEVVQAQTRELEEHSVKSLPSAKGKAMKPVNLVNNPSMIFAGIFSPPKICLPARARGVRGGWSLDNGAMCPVISKK